LNLWDPVGPITLTRSPSCVTSEKAKSAKVVPGSFGLIAQVMVTSSKGVNVVFEAASVSSVKKSSMSRSGGGSIGSKTPPMPGRPVGILIRMGPP
jgi:hypothetical protein